MKTVYLGLGSNVGDREAMIRRAVEELRAAGVNLMRLSPIYETEPQGFAEQEWFLNAVAEGETDLMPRQLLARVGSIERKMKRRRTIRNGPRTIDIDILFFGNAVVRTPDLEIPHPRYRERRFVLAPLVDLAPGLRDPVTGEHVSEILSSLRGQTVRAWHRHERAL